MKKNLTEIVFILDRSGSMSGLEKDTVGGFNSLIKKQRGIEGECLVSTVLFDDRCEVLHDRVKLEDVPEMTERDYYVRGSTALIDAIGGAVHHIANVHRYIREEDVPEHTMFVITTDGMENASCKYSADKVRAMIEKQKECGWEFLFIGANIDSVRTAASFGISRDRAADYKADAQGTEALYETVSDTVCAMRCCQSIAPDWSEKLKKQAARQVKK